MVAKLNYLAGHYVLQALTIAHVPATSLAGLHAVLAEHGMSLADLGKPDTHIPIHWIEKLLNDSAFDPALIGIYSASRAQLTTQGPLSILLMTSSCIRDALRLTLKFSPLLTTAVSLMLEEDEHRAYLFISTNTHCKSFNRLIVFYIAAAIRRLVLLATGTTPDMVMELAMSKPEGLKSSALFDPRLWKFDAPANCLVMPLSVLDLSGHFVDPVSHRIARQACEEALAANGEHVLIVDKVRALLLKSTTAYPSQDELAQRLHLSRSTLKRQLALEKTSFNALLQEAKKQHAMKLLGKKEVSLQAIAEQLGYADQSNFSHAFKKWTGKTPASYRRILI